MRTRFILPIIALAIFACDAPKDTTASVIDTSSDQEMEQGILVIHGGAGTIKKEDMTDEKEAAYRAKLTEALQAGYEVLQNGGESCEAVIKTINVMEDSPLFNAGVGAVFTADEENELDASIMRGRDLNAGAISGVKTLKNPINTAYEVMENSPHVMLTSSGAEEFAVEQGMETVDPEYFRTDWRLEQLRARKEYGTVGAVALDKEGNLCAGTSTGGMTNKKWGRVGDSPIIGAGTYCDNETAGVSATGHGEYFIRSVSAYEVSALMKYKNYTVDQAAQESIDQTAELGGTGGLVALDKNGNVSMPFSSDGMYRGYVTSEGEIVVKIYKDE